MRAHDTSEESVGMVSLTCNGRGGRERFPGSIFACDTGKDRMIL